MNYNQRGVITRQQELKSGSKKIAVKGAVIVFRVLLIAMVSIVFLGGFIALGALRGLVSSSPSLVNLDLEPDEYKTSVYYADGTLSTKLIKSGSNRSYAEIETIPQLIRYAFIAKEDTRFYEHKGIDVQGIFRALVSDIRTRSFDYGGSTITQQLLKNQVFGGGEEKNVLTKITRKVQEQFLAIQAENMYTKDEILELYINVINFGNGNYGIQEAARGYFGKDAQSLTLSEACVLAPIAYSPTYRNPVTHQEENAEKRLELLDAMLEGNFCTKEEYDEAVNDDVYTRIAEYQEMSEESSHAPYSYFTDALITQLTNDLQTKLGYTNIEASTLIYSGGLQIYTTQDPTIQKIVDKEFNDPDNFPAIGSGSYYYVDYRISVYDENDETIVTHYQNKDFLAYYENYQDKDHKYYHEPDEKKKVSWVGINSAGTNYNSEVARCYGIDLEDINNKIDEFRKSLVEYTTEDGEVKERKCYETRSITLQPQAAVTVIDHTNGHVVALYGGRGTKTSSLTLNRATQTKRNVGSTFKVLASFLPALDGGGQTLASVVDDSQFVYPGTAKEVINWYKTGYRGITPMRAACYDSMNVCAVEFLERIKPSLSFSYLQKLGFSTLVKSEIRNGQVMSDINLALALGGLTDGVINLELTAAYATIANQGCYQEPILYTKVYDRNGNLLLYNESKSTQVIKSSTAWLLTSAMEDVIKVGTGSRLKFLDYQMHEAGKTGTSTGSKDLWFVGFTPYYTAGIWSGFDQPFTQTDTHYQQHIWRKIMEGIHSTLELPDKEFEMPDSIVTAEICTKCGKLAVKGLCDEYVGGNCIATEYFAKGTVPTEKCTCHVRVPICTESGHIASPECPTSSIKYVVYLDKVERDYYDVVAAQKALDNGEEYVPPELEEGEEPIKIVTRDTPYILPRGEQADPCPVHCPDAYDDGGGSTFDIPDDDDIPVDDEPADDTVID